MPKNPAAPASQDTDLLRSARRIVLSSYVANGMVAALGLLLVTVLVHLFLGPAAAAAATVGAIVVTPPDQPAPRRGKFTHFLPAVLIGTRCSSPPACCGSPPSALACCWGARPSSPSSARPGAGAACRFRSR
jgi:hypothetical protein